eukprot:1901356-Heterocapsa_arctica.AAC.1
MGNNCLILLLRIQCERMKRTLASSTQAAEEIFSSTASVSSAQDAPCPPRTQAAQRLDKSYCDGKRAKRARSPGRRPRRGLTSPTAKASVGPSTST